MIGYKTSPWTSPICSGSGSCKLSKPYGLASLTLNPRSDARNPPEKAPGRESYDRGERHYLCSNLNGWGTALARGSSRSGAVQVSVPLAPSECQGKRSQLVIACVAGKRLASTVWRSSHKEMVRLGRNLSGSCSLLIYLWPEQASCGIKPVVAIFG